MGAWGDKAFENDAALDWLAELESGGTAVLRETLTRVAEYHEDEYLDVDDGASAIAAAEIVAAALGHRRAHMTTVTNAWVDANRALLAAEDVALARRAVERVLAGRSELRALWDDQGLESPWRAEVRSLRDLLTGELGASSTAPPVRRTSPRAPRFEQEKQALVTFLHLRGFQLSEQEMSRIEDSDDAEEVQRWLARAVDAPSLAAVLDG